MRPLGEILPLVHSHSLVSRLTKTAFVYTRSYTFVGAWMRDFESGGSTYTFFKG